MNRRQFVKRGALTVGGLGLTSTAFKCSGKTVTFYDQTLSSFLNELAGLVPAQALFISKIVKVIADFDSAYQRGDFASAAGFFNTMVQNISSLTADLGVGLSDHGKMLLSVVSVTVRTLAVLLKDQGASNVAAVAAAKTSSVAASAAVSTISQLATGVDATFAATKLP